MSYRNPSQHTLNMLNSSQSNFNSAFAPNPNFIPQRDTKNYGNLIHNNVNNNLLSEMVSEYTIHIDGKDRNTTSYPNPFSFSVSLGGPAPRYERIVDPDTKEIVQNQIAGVPNPRIDMNFKNVKYVKLKYILLPRNIRYDLALDPSGNKSYSIATTKHTILSNYRYLLLKVKEIANDKLYSTNDTLKNDSFIIYRDSNYNEAYNDLWFATQPVKIYYDNGLKNLSKLTIQILTPSGEELKLLSYNSGVLSNIPYIEINEDNSTKIPSSDFYTDFNSNGQVNINMEFEIGVCENQINSEKNYK
jgi:hypothetical protein